MNEIFIHQQSENAMLNLLNSSKLFFQKIGLIITSLLVIEVDLYGQTNNYFGSSGTLDGSFWSTIPAGPYTSILNTTGGAIINFNNVANVTGATITISGINVNADITSWVGGGTLATGGTIANINVASGITLNMISQSISTMLGTGFSKTGPGVLALGAGSNYSGGFTLNNGSIIIGGVNALGNNALNLNGGIVASDANMNLTGRYPGGIFIGGNIQFGDVGGLANAGASLTFDNNILLGATNRQLTIGNAGTVTLSGVISGTNGLTLTANSNGTGIFDITNLSNSFTGPLNIMGGRIRIAADGCLGNAANTILIDGGQLLNNASFNIANTHLVKLGPSAGTGIRVATGTLTIDAVMEDNASNGSFTKFDAGTLMLTNANTFTGITYIDAAGGILHLNRPGGGTLPSTNNIVQYGGMLKIGTDQTLNDISLMGGNITVDNGATLTINGTFDYFQPGSITLTGTGKIIYGPAGTLKYSGAISKSITASEFPVVAGPFNLINNNSSNITLPFNRTIKGSLLLNSGNFAIGAGALLDLDGASLNSIAGYLDATFTSDLTVQGTTGGTVILPTNSNISFRNVTVNGSRTLALNGTNDFNLYGLMTIGSAASFDNGGESQVLNGGGGSVNIVGSFITKDKEGFTGTNAAIPGIVPTLSAGCTIEYGLATGGPQAVTARADYHHIKFSGKGTKTIITGFNPAGTVYITGSAIVDATNQTFGSSSTNLTMDGGRLKLSGTNNPQPHMGGVYSLTGGVIEYACNSVSGQTIRKETYQKIEVTGMYVGNSVGNITLNTNGIFTVKSGGVFEINDDGIVGPGLKDTVKVETGATFKTGDKDGFSGGTGSTATSVNQDVDIVILATGSTVEYSRNSDQNITNVIPYQKLLISGSTGVKKAPSGTLVINGNLVKSGGSSFAHNNGVVLFSNMTATQDFTNTGSTDFNFYDLTNDNSVGSGLTINNNLGISNMLSLSANSKLNLSVGDITLLSTATNTARVAMIPATADITYTTGRFNVERYFPGDRSWRLITSPLSTFGTPGSIYSNWQNNGIYTVGKGTLITGKLPNAGNGLDPSSTQNYSMKKFENNAYVNVDNTLVSISNGLSLSGDNLGYFMFIRGDRNPANTVIPNTNNTTLTSRGKLQTGTQILPGLARTGAGRYFALVGNPFASPVNFKNLARVNLVNRFVVWDPKINQVGAFIEFDDFDNDGTYTQSKASPGGQDLNIQSGQAFFIETDAMAGASSIRFEESDKTGVNNQGIFRPMQPITQRAAIRSSLYLVNAGTVPYLADGNYVAFKGTYNSGVDFQDALKFSNIHENFSLMRNKMLIGIERRPLIADNDTLFFNLVHMSQRNYQFLFEPENLDPLLVAFLEDKHTGLKTALPLSSPSVFNFTIDSNLGSATADRFSITFKQATPLAIAMVNIKARQLSGGILVEWTGENEKEIVKYELEKSGDGLNFGNVNTTFTANTNNNLMGYNWIDLHPLTGSNFYRLRIVYTDGEIHYSNVALVKMGTAERGVRIYPNPVTNHIIGVEFKNLSAGTYKVKLVNAQGQNVLSKNIPHTAGSSKKFIQTDYKLPSGIYQLEIIAPDKVMMIAKVIVL